MNNISKFSLIGVSAILITILSDIVLLGRPVGSLEFFRLGTESMAELANWRIFAGTIAGVIALPFQAAGLIPLYYGLKPASRKISLFVVILLVHALLMGVAFHTSYIFIAGAWKLYYETGIDASAAYELVKTFHIFWKIIIVLMAAELLVGSACLVLLIIKGKTLFPRWVVVFNPLTIVAFVFVILLLIPKPIGGFISPAYLNICNLVFVTIIFKAVESKLSKP